MTVFLIAGEASGDIHAAALVRKLRERHSEAQFAGLGGDAMREEGVRLYQDYRQIAYMGVVAVIRHACAIRRNFRIAQEALLREQPDALFISIHMNTYPLQACRGLQVYYTKNAVETAIEYHDKKMVLNNLKPGKRDTKGTKVRF